MGSGLMVAYYGKTKAEAYKDGVGDGACYWELRRPDSNYPTGHLKCGYNLDKKNLPTDVELYEIRL